MYLRNDHLVNSLCKIFELNPNLILIDISWGKLSPRDLNILTKSLSKHARSIRNLNLSYNELNFNTNSLYFKDSQ